MSDVATAATMNALNVERLQLRASVEALQALLEERRAYAERLLAENVRLSNEAAERIKDYELTKTVLESTTGQLLSAIAWIDGQDVRSDFPNATAMRQALDRERERCGVLEREVKQWRECYQDYLCSGVWGNGGVMLQPKEVQATDTRHALDAAKFVGGGQ